jgi:hypothetical protein
MGFNTFVSNLLAIPNTVISIILMLFITYLAEVTGQLTWVSILGQIYTLPFVVYLYVVDTTTANKWVVWAIVTLLLGFPNGMCVEYDESVFMLTTIQAHAIQVGWNSRNSNTVRSRTVSAAMYNMCVQASGIISSNIYRAGMSSNRRSKDLNSHPWY